MSDEKTFFSLFSGGELAGVGAHAAGYRHIGGVEIDPRIAEVAKMNGFDVTVADVLDVKPSEFDRPTLFHASPVCTRASQANPNAKEAEIDIATARKTAEFITAWTPQFVTIENVIAYRHFESFAIILRALSAAGYMYSVEHLNAADFGVPQTRRRLFVRAVLGGFVPYLPAPVKWVGWYEAIEDLLDTLPESEFAPWQIARLPDLNQSMLVGQHKTPSTGLVQHSKEKEPSFTITAARNQLSNRAFLFSGAGNTNLKEAVPGKGVRWADEPAQTVAASGAGGRVERAFLISGENSSSARAIDKNEPSFTLSSSQKAAHRAWLEYGKVVKMTPRALARFQGIPDSYVLPDIHVLAGEVIGNSVSSLKYQRIVEVFG